ncbi:glycosyltransferase family 9 protein [Aquincola sp. S2]|uniref:Glycosyltransferase family 9 protein n=1 Tax=Pseudaquabacterium terrae TaxID=2732868 RepID=A0ABX2EMR3_9BURK|nr:glycosyltransferase family 9 protein [Aquabacterium terrae]
MVVRFPAVGDAVLLTVLLNALAERYGRPVHLLSSGEWTPVLLGHDPALSELRLVASRRSPHWLTPSRWSAVRWLRAHRGPVYLCDPDVHGERIIARAGIPEPRLVRAWQHWPGDGIHWADWWLQIAQLDAADVPGPARVPQVPPRPRLVVPAAWHDEAGQWLQRLGLAQRPLVLVQPGHKKTYKRGRLGTGTHDKHWPAQRWATVIRGVLAELPDAAVLVCGSAREAGLAQAIVDAAAVPASQGLVINGAAHQLTLQRLAGLAARAVGMISVDTGPAHVAGAMDCPLVVLYGQAGWKRWKPRSASGRVIALGPCEPSPDAKVMDIEPAQVLAAWHALQREEATA